MSSGGGKGNQSYVVGYWYLVDILFALCHSMSKLKAIKVGDKIAWTGAASAGRISINQRISLGEKAPREGLCAESIDGWKSRPGDQ